MIGVNNIGRLIKLTRPIKGTVLVTEKGDVGYIKEETKDGFIIVLDRYRGKQSIFLVDETEIELYEVPDEELDAELPFSRTNATGVAENYFDF